MGLMGPVSALLVQYCPHASDGTLILTYQDFSCSSIWAPTSCVNKIISYNYNILYNYQVMETLAPFLHCM